MGRGLAQGVALPACNGSAVTVADFSPRAVADADSVSATVSAAGAYSMTVAPGTYTMAYSFTNGRKRGASASLRRVARRGGGGIAGSSHPPGGSPFLPAATPTAA